MKSRLLNWWKTRKPNVLEMIDKCRTIGFAIFIFGLIWLYFTDIEYMWMPFALYILILANRVVEMKKKKQNDDMYDPEVPDALDKIIQQCFDEFILMNTGYQKEHYINQTEEQEIVNRMIDKVSERISDTIYTKLELYYNSAAVPDIVANKIYMAVMAYVIENNKTKTSVKSKAPDILQSI